jgi:hypothetical protein
MLFQGRAKKVSIRFANGDRALYGPICNALLTLLSPKDVCCLQVFNVGQDLEIQFMARPAKADALVHISSLIIPGGLIQIEDTTIVHAQSCSNRADLTSQRADWEVSVRQ